MTTLALTTTDGVFLAHYSPHGLARLEFPTSSREPSPTTEAAPPAEVRAWHRLTQRALKDALQGRATTELPPLDLSSGTDFQRRVWQEMLKIKTGETRSYGEIAEGIHAAKAVRAVGGACGANPIPIFVPCHRVLAANQKLGGFSSGLDWKKLLLKREKITLPNELF